MIIIMITITMGLVFNLDRKSGLISGICKYMGNIHVWYTKQYGILHMAFVKWIAIIIASPS